MINFVEYNGEGNAKEWITKFEFHCEWNVKALGGRTKESLLQYALSGDAFEWYSDHSMGGDQVEVLGSFRGVPQSGFGFGHCCPRKYERARILCHLQS